MAHKFIFPGQTRSILGRKMIHRVCLFRQVFYSIREEKRRQWHLQLDQSKAFDWVDHRSLWTTLEQLDVPKTFPALLKAVYADLQVFPTLRE